MNSKVRHAECPDCHATGVYRGTMEPKNVGVVCATCQGSGRVESDHLPLFTGRKRRGDIARVFSSISSKRGTYVGQGISYEEFFKGLIPNKTGTTTL